jgi:hypothetical protein
MGNIRKNATDSSVSNVLRGRASAEKCSVYPHICGHGKSVVTNTVVST